MPKVVLLPSDFQRYFMGQRKFDNRCRVTGTAERWVNVKQVSNAFCGVCAAVIALWMSLGAAIAQDQAKAQHGLMWHRTGLPAVFPLQVRTPAGQDFYLLLRDHETGEAALAAFIEGGRFFRVLVPPGTFDLRFAYGTDWQGEDALFGPGDGTKFVTMKEPLTFKVRNFSTKGGHVIDLSDLAEGREARATVAPQNLCQTFALEVPRHETRRRTEPDPGLDTALEGLEERFVTGPLVEPDEAEPGDDARRAPRYDLRWRSC